MKKLMEGWNKFLTEVENEHNKEEVMFNSLSALGVFALEEGDESKSSDALRAISAGEWDKDPVSFYSSLTCEGQEEETCVNKHPEMTTPYSVTELGKMDLFKVPDMNIGFALKEKDGSFQEIVSVHNNETGVGGVGKMLMEAAIGAGGCFLDHFDVGQLSGLYSSMGFEEYGEERLPFDPQYVSAGFAEKYGESDIIFRKHQNC
jgi:hypothetical protein